MGIRCQTVQVARQAEKAFVNLADTSGLVHSQEQEGSKNFKKGSFYEFEPIPVNPVQFSDMCCMSR